MAEKKGELKSSLQENPLVAQLIARGADTAMTLRGFVGPATTEGYVRLYPRLNNLADSVEIAQADILHSVAVPKSALGAVILWVKKDARINVHRIGISEPAGTPAQNFVELRKGRLRMRVKAQQARAGCYSCFSTCMDCISWCSCLICSSHPQ